MGEPISFGDVVEMAEERGWTDAELYRAVTDKIGPSSDSNAWIKCKALGLKMAQLWSELENQPLPTWANSNWSLHRHPIVSKDIFRSSQYPSAMRIVWNRVENRVRQSQQCFTDYLEYCQIRCRHMSDQIVSLA